MVALALVAQVCKLGDAFFLFAVAILPAVFFLGLVTYGRLLQSGIEDTIYSAAINRIREFYAELDPSHAEFFHESHSDHLGLRAAGVFKLNLQQFLSAAAMVLMVNALVGGVFLALTASALFHAAAWVSTSIGAGLHLGIGYRLLQAPVAGLGSRYAGFAAELRALA